MLTALDPTRCAVLAIDFTEGIVDRFATCGREAVARAVALCGAACASGVPTAYIVPGQFGHDGQPRLMLGKLLDDFEPAEQDRIIYKNRIGAFASTDLDQYLRLNRRDTLVIAGIATSGTVLSTSRAAFDAGYKVIVPADACSDADEAVHVLLTTRIHPESWVGLWRIADICSVDEIIAAWRAEL
jgi:nicotinamidase-related amidase